MERPGIHEIAIRDQLKTKRNLLFSEFLRNPLNTSLAIEIKSIDDRIAELMGRLMEERESEPDRGRFSSKKKHEFSRSTYRAPTDGTKEATVPCL